MELGSADPKVMRELCATSLKLMNFVRNQGGNLKIFHCGNHISKTKWDLFFIVGMNISYPLFSNFDLPIGNVHPQEESNGHFIFSKWLSS